MSNLMTNYFSSLSKTLWNRFNILIDANIDVLFLILEFK